MSSITQWLPAIISAGTLVVAVIILFRKIPKESDISVMRGDLDKISNNLKDGLALSQETTTRDLERLQSHLMDLMKVQHENLSLRMDRFEDRMDRQIARLEARIESIESRRVYNSELQ